MMMEQKKSKFQILPPLNSVLVSKPCLPSCGGYVACMASVSCSSYNACVSCRQISGGGMVKSSRSGCQINPERSEDVMESISCRRLCVAGLLVRVDVPYDVVRQTVDPISCPLGHLGETFRLCLVLEGIGGEVDAYSEAIVSDEVSTAVVFPATNLIGEHQP